MTLYAKRDVVAQGAHYLRHIRAMTAEGLHSKSDIAAELAHRDILIEELASSRHVVVCPCCNGARCAFCDDSGLLTVIKPAKPQTGNKHG